MGHHWKVVINFRTKEKYYYHTILKTIISFPLMPQIKHSYSTKYFNTLKKKDLTEDIIKNLTKPRNHSTMLVV